MLEGSPIGPVRRALNNTCPNCGEGSLFTSWLRMAPSCSSCDFDFSELDAGDGPASFLVLIYGALIVPLAFLLEVLASPPLWLQALLWGVVMLIATIKSLRPLKALIIGWQFRIHDPDKKYF
ncbi:MAG: hypothetical protein CBC12_11550 [Candidatus Puniceispirillum sp. TMED52]|nr:hypothetical protein [SAR116 cluster bacterium]OUU46476.1 MAG: hypothetical protein CBC12_11550 [Candidatus Puniceispirillum sp. TMED52]